MDIAEKMAADIALAIDGGDWQDAKWFSKFHREAWIKAVQPYADEIERLRGLIDKHINEKAELKQGMIDILEYLSSVQIAEVNIKHIARKALGEIPDAALEESE